MHIIESFKARARQGFTNTIHSLHQDNQPQDLPPLDPPTTNNPLIQQITPNDENDEYQEQQFQYFAKTPNPNKHKCVVCKKTDPKYTCPKCKVKYCSSEHYKTHNLFCTQKFFKSEVESLLKRTKTSKEQRKKMVEMLRANQAELTEDSDELLRETKVQEIQQHRLNQILASLQEGGEVRLSEGEMKNFQAYLKEIEYASLQEQGGQTTLFQEYVPFWRVQEGLQQYFMLQPITIEQYNQSKHKEIIEYRRKAAEALRKNLLSISKGINFKKTSIFVVYELLQVVYLTALLFRSFNGQYLTNTQFLESFLLIYDNNIAKMLSETHPSSLLQLPSYQFPTVMPLIKSKIANLSQGELVSLFKSWLPLVIQDAAIILANKYICLQAIYRLIETFKQKSVSGKDSKYTPIIKKLQFLLLFTNSIVFTNEAQMPQQFKGNIYQDLIAKVLKSDSQSQKQERSLTRSEQQKEEAKKQRLINELLKS